MARNKVEFKVTHVFKDGTVASDTSGHPVPAKIAMQVLAIAERVRARHERETAEKLHSAEEICAAGP